MAAVSLSSPVKTSPAKIPHASPVGIFIAEEERCCHGSNTVTSNVVSTHAMDAVPGEVLFCGGGSRTVDNRLNAPDKLAGRKETKHPVRYCVWSAFFLALSPLLLPVSDWAFNKFIHIKNTLSAIYGAGNPHSLANRMITASEALGGLPFNRGLVHANIFSNHPTHAQVMAYQSKEVNGICDQKDSLNIPIPGKKVEIQAWYSPARAHKPTLIFSLGVEGEVAKAGPLVKLLKQDGFGILLYQYPFYGNPLATRKPHGKPSEELCLETLDYLSHYLEEGKQPDHRKIPFDRQILLGYSLGGIVSVHTAARNKKDYLALVIIGSPRSALDFFRAMAAESTDDAVRIAKVFANFWRFFKRNGMETVEQVLEEVFDNSKVIKTIHQPMLFVHGEQDFLAKLKNTLEIAKFAENSTYVRMLTIPGANHSNIRNEENSKLVLAALKRFLDGYDSYRPEETWSYSQGYRSPSRRYA